MSDEAKNEILRNIRSALNNVPDDEQIGDINVPRSYHQKGELAQKELVKLFIERVGEYRATVSRVREDQLIDVISKSCQREEVQKLVIPEGFPHQWLPDDIDPMWDRSEKQLTHQELDSSDGVISTCALAVAQTGTIILDAGKGQGRRALSLLPDYHLCIVRQSQVVELVPEGFAHFDEKVKNEGPPITFISGPSATSDIELSRVEGVHGPRRLEILVVTEEQDSVK